MTEMDYQAAAGRLLIAVADIRANLRELAHGLGVEISGEGIIDQLRCGSGDLPPWREEWVTQEAISAWLDQVVEVLSAEDRIVRAYRRSLPPREYIMPSDPLAPEPPVVREYSLDEIQGCVDGCEEVHRRGDELASGLGLTLATGGKLYGYRSIANRLYGLLTTPGEPAELWPAGSTVGPVITG